MRGSHLHNVLLLAPIEEHFARIGATVHREFWTRSPALSGFVDLFVLHRDNRLVFEAERSAARVDRDVRKATQLEATYLLFIVPVPRVGSAVRRSLRRRSAGPCEPPVLVMTVGHAMAWVTSFFPLLPASNDHRTERPKYLEQ
jgi:hypothetical protein